MESYKRHDYVASAEKREISGDETNTLILYENLGKDMIEASASVRIMVGTNYVDIDAVDIKDIKVVGPNFRTRDGYFIVSYDNQIMSVQEGEENER